MNTNRITGVSIMAAILLVNAALPAFAAEGMSEELMTFRLGAAYTIDASGKGLPAVKDGETADRMPAKTTSLKSRKVKINGKNCSFSLRVRSGPYIRRKSVIPGYDPVAEEMHRHIEYDSLRDAVVYIKASPVRGYRMGSVKSKTEVKGVGGSWNEEPKIGGYTSYIKTNREFSIGSPSITVKNEGDRLRVVYKAVFREYKSKKNISDGSGCEISDVCMTKKVTKTVTYKKQ